jgi:uncharacterized protein (DUF2252 family)
MSASAKARTRAGRSARAQVPRRAHAGWKPAPSRADPIGVLESQAARRVPELVPIRYGRMVASPFAFFRGGAAIMAADLATTPRSGFQAQLSGDAHMANFGGYASPDRDLVFDLNDFDETFVGPWEWDLKRLAASVAVAGRDHGEDQSARRNAVSGVSAAYREAVQCYAQMRALDVWYSRIDAEDVLQRVQTDFDRKTARRLKQELAKAKRKDNLRALSKLTTRESGATRIASDPPILVPLTELLPDVEAEAVEAELRAIIRRYIASLPPDLEPLIGNYELVDLARKVVGVGSVGTRAYVALLLGRDDRDPLFLQVKEAQPSVLQSWLGRGRFANQGRRVVDGQRRIQAASDILLGWVRARDTAGVQNDFYVRQMWDWKYSPPLEALDADGLEQYARLCGRTLARAHARTGDRLAIAGYLGSGNAFDDAIVSFAEDYADQNARDHRALVDAIKAGRITADNELGAS